ncbi:Sulfate/thiosulfate import ATP-binding protein CysA [Paenibacillus plantiphilus]|uniref:Sulfate/thiosulfate import ATP-binding protein CysA n=1 Tax=Paenibacillus plantiphilus TaxID=2905650 RepID=A0ABM9CHB1_9BACL|nr:ATP-binding cassette domain-containing protein [Paenibacillus plantiphilus]CAH1214443.1 Sulfate/thiosulfate import ATP-binding protein CysA [Paenibacillus plantiphilus]
MSIRITLSNVEYSRGTFKLAVDTPCTFAAGINYVVGRNGAGKSTALKLLATAVEPEKGSMIFTMLTSEEGAGMHRKQLSVEEARALMGFLPQHFTGYSDMTIERYLTCMAFHKGIPHRLVKAALEKWLMDSKLLELRKRKLRALSGGQLQKVGLIQALINQPRICILDEPFEGLDNQEKTFFKRVIYKLSHHSIIIISTNFPEDMEQGDQKSLFYLDEGKLRMYDEMAEVDSLPII